MTNIDIAVPEAEKEHKLTFTIVYSNKMSTTNLMILLAKARRPFIFAFVEGKKRAEGKVVLSKQGVTWLP